MAVYRPTYTDERSEVRQVGLISNSQRYLAFAHDTARVSYT